MLRNLKEIKGCSLHARDGAIGEIKDVFFDDHRWHVRYFVVETGAWLKKRQVLISPIALGTPDWAQQVFPVKLTKEQVRNSPSVDTDKPVSRQYEGTLREYYGWPPYWGTMFAEGGIATPVITPPTAADPSSRGDIEAGPSPRRKGDPFLRSAQDTLNYPIEAIAGAIGHVDDFLFDDGAWRVRYLVVDPRNWLPGRKVVLAPDWIRDVSWEKKCVYVDLSREAIKGSPPYDAATPWNHAYGAELHDHYQRPRYSDWDEDITAGAPPRDGGGKL